MALQALLCSYFNFLRNHYIFYQTQFNYLDKHFLDFVFINISMAMKVRIMKILFETKDRKMPLS